MHLEHVEMVHRAAEAVDVLVDRRPARLGLERERRASLAVAVGGLQAELRVRLGDRGVVGEPGHVLDRQPHCCCCASWIAIAATGMAPAREERLRERVAGAVDADEQLAELCCDGRSGRVARAPRTRARRASRPSTRCGGAWSPAIRSTAVAHDSQAVEDGAGEGRGADELLRDREGLERRPAPADVRLERAARLQQRDQLEDALRVVLREQDGDRIAGADDAGRRRGALEVEAELDELVRIAVRHRRVGAALEAVRAVSEVLEERRAGRARRRGGSCGRRAGRGC